MRTRWSRNLLVALLVSTGVSLGAARADASTRVYVSVGPPVAVAQVRPVMPGPRHVWVDGYQRWNGTAYVWVPGRWALPPRGRVAWVPGRWVHDRHGWYYVAGRWR
jgi:hypothetical protein